MYDAPQERARKLARDDGNGHADDGVGPDDDGVADELLGSHSGLDLAAYASGTHEKLVETINAAQELPESMQRIIISPEQPILDETAEGLHAYVSFVLVLSHACEPVCFRLASVCKLRKKWLFKANEPSVRLVGAAQPCICL